MLWWMLLRLPTEPGTRRLLAPPPFRNPAKTGPGERNCAVMSDAGAVVRFVRETVAREHANTA
jgi:hypothetical protein